MSKDDGATDKRVNSDYASDDSDSTYVEVHSHDSNKVINNSGNDGSDEDDNASGNAKQTTHPGIHDNDAAMCALINRTNQCFQVGCGRVPSMDEVRETHKFLMELKAEMQLYEANGKTLYAQMRYCANLVFAAYAVNSA